MDTVIYIISGVLIGIFITLLAVKYELVTKENKDNGT